MNTENTVTLTYEQLARVLDIFGKHEGFISAIYDEYVEVEAEILADNPNFAEWSEKNPVEWYGW